MSERGRRDVPLACAPMGIAALVVVAALFAATPALARRGHEFGKAFGTVGSGEGQFKEPAGIAVNEATHQLYVVDKGNDRVEVFSSTGAFEGQFDGSGTFEVKGVEESGKPAKAGAFVSPNTIAVDNACVQNGLTESSKPITCKEFDPSNGDVYVQDGFEHHVVDKFTPEGDFIAELLVPEESSGSLVIRSVAVDAQGHPWVSEVQALSGNIGFARFSKSKDSAVEEVELEELAHPATFGFQLEPGLALDTHGDIFAGAGSHFSVAVITKLSPPQAGKVQELQEAIDEEAAEAEEAASGVAVEIPANGVYVDNETSIRRFDDEEPPAELERFGQGHLSKGSGVAVDAVAGTVWVADQGANQVVEFKPEEPRAPTIGRESSAAITADSASFQAEVNPRGAFAEYRFQYGRCATSTSCKESGFEASTPVPDGPVGADFEEHEVSAHVQDLEPATTYHFQIVAHNNKGETAGEELSFTTQPAGVLGSLDGRGYEMVSPAQKNGTLIKGILNSTPIEASPAGEAITYVTASPTEAEPAGYSNAVQVLSSRDAGGWSSKDVTIAHPTATGQSIGKGNEYRFSSEDLSHGILQPLGAFEPGVLKGQLTEEATEQTPYLRSNYESGDPSKLCASDCLRPLVTAKNVVEGVAFGNEARCISGTSVFCGPQVLSGTSDLAHVVLHSEVGLSGQEGDHGGLYEWSGGTLQLVSILPSRKPASPAVSQVLGREDAVMRRAISPDGDRIVWSNGAHLYLRRVAEEETVELDAGLSKPGTVPEFQTANSQTTKIFLSEEGGLYLYDTETNERTTLVKAGGGVQGTVIGASEDGSYVYFVANEALPGVEGAVSGNCKGAAANSCNLYELHEEGGSWQARLAAVLSGGDSPDFGGNLMGLTARVSPDGSHLAFMSQRPLTGYDNRDASSGKRDEEVFGFDAGTGALSCASCRPTGGRPEGVEYKTIKDGIVAGAGVWETTTWLAASVPGWTPFSTGVALHQSRYLDDSGRLFFNSADALSPQDVNGTQDVYEYEPPGIGGCSEASPSFSSRSGGCVGLISSGTSREESAFMDASQSGADVFFLTSSKLVPEDFDTALDIYDAHECTTGSPCITPPPPTPPPCTTEASCKPAPTPQPEIFGAPASATFTGLGNLTPEPSPPPTKPKPLTQKQKLAKALTACRSKYRHSKSRRAKCERNARKAHATTARKSNHKRRTR
jgi:DNA-binding beta-propeller fold protein YncE